MYDADPDVKQVVDVAKGLEGLRRQDGIHAAAVVITKEPLTDLPAHPAQAGERPRRPSDAPIVTQYEMHGVEDLGLLKMDFLGLRNLDVIEDTVALIRATQGSRVRHRHRPPRRRADARAAAAGATRSGVFQLESRPMRTLMRSLAPTDFDDVAAARRPVPAGADGRQHAQRLRRPQERPQAVRTSTRTPRRSWPTPTA